MSLGRVAEPKVEWRDSQCLPSVVEMGTMKDLQAAFMAQPCKHHVPGAGSPACGASGEMIYVCRSQSLNTVKGWSPEGRQTSMAGAQMILGGGKSAGSDGGGDERCCCY